MQEAYQLAPKHSDGRKAKNNKKNNSKRPYLVTKETGNRVLIRSFSQREGTVKLISYWEDQIHTALSNVGENLEVYKLRPEHESKGNVRTLHRNMLKHCDDLLDNFSRQIKKNSSKNHPSNNNQDQRIRNAARCKSHLLIITVVKLTLN